MNSIIWRRTGIIVNYLSIIGWSLMTFTYKSWAWTWFISAIFIFLVGISFTTYYYIYAKSGIWEKLHPKNRKWNKLLTHTTITDLDEREVLVVYEALRYGYTIFSIISILIIWFYDVIPESLNDNLFIGINLLYLSQLLPSSIIAWREKQV